MGRVNLRSRALERRIRRTCYYGEGRPLDQLSLPLTEAVVEYFTKNAPFDDLDPQYASEVSYAGAVSPSVMIVAMIYLERMRTNNKGHFESSDPADLFVSALLCASKFLYDEAEKDFVYNDEWALSCGRTLFNINKMEVDFLNALKWDTMARERDFSAMLRRVEMMIAKRQCERRGFFCYSDLSVLTSTLADVWNEIILPAFAAIGLATLAYTAVVFGLYTSSLYSSIAQSNRTTFDLPAPFAPLSAPFAQLPPQPKVLVAPSFASFNDVQSAGTRQPRRFGSPSLESSSSSLLSPDVLMRNRVNATVCGKSGKEKEIGLAHLVGAWFPSASVFPMLSV